MDITRRSALASALSAAALPAVDAAAPIDRRALVGRHHPVARGFDPLGPLSVGNGELAFTFDPTGLQTFPDIYEPGIPLCTQSQWGWHSRPAPVADPVASYKLTAYDTHGRPVGYPTGSQGQKELFDWLRENPHRLNLVRIGLRLQRADLSPAASGDLRAVEQTLELWTGVAVSRFEFDGVPVRVETACHPTLDQLAFVIESPLLASGRLQVEFAFPYGSPEVNASDWASDARHSTVLASSGARAARFERKLDDARYFIALNWEESADLRPAGPHRFTLRSASSRLAFSCLFSPVAPTARGLGAPEVLAASRRHWPEFWSTGGAVEFSGSRDPRSRELERRVVLSQYLTAIQCAGSLPPQETGLTCNSWYGKFHLEMHWWHAVHFAYWNRLPLLERSLGYYASILDSARRTARGQGYNGARWPKMTARDGRDSPSPIGPLLIWQQPHPIYYAELCRRARPERRTLELYRDVVFETAEFMAAFAWRDPARNAYVLGPPVIPAQENHPPRETWNPAYELSYWRWGLEIAQRWREALGLAREPRWEAVRTALAPLPVAEGVYLAHENCPQTYTERNRDHPSMLMALGFLPGDGADPETMRRTLKRVMTGWKWPDTWGWDYPMVAMTAARLAEPEIAVDALLLETPKNRYLPNGHNYQRPGLHLYLPGNGGLLTAVAMMAAGWDGGPQKPAPGFPAGWTVRWEGLARVI